MKIVWRHRIRLVGAGMKKAVLMGLLLISQWAIGEHNALTEEQARRVLEDRSAAYEKNPPKTFKDLINLKGRELATNIPGLARSICFLYEASGSKMVDEIKSTVIKYMDIIEGIKRPTNAQILQFLNDNKHAMTCGKDNRNYMMVAFDNGHAHKKLIEDLFLDVFYDESEQVFIDINAISNSGPNGQPETVLDYMYRRVGTAASQGFKKEIEDLIDAFEEETVLGAKRCPDLPECKALLEQFHQQKRLK